MGPVSQADGHDEPRPIGEVVPRRAAVIEDIAVSGEDPVGDPVLPHVLPDVLDRVQLGCRGFEICIDGLSIWLMRIGREIGRGTSVQALRE